MKFWLKYKNGAYHNELLGEQILPPDRFKYGWILLVGILTYLFSKNEYFPLLMVAIIIFGTKFKTESRGSFPPNPFSPIVVDYAQLSIWGFMLGYLALYFIGTYLNNWL